jgi:hypothetical protein
MIDVPTPGSGRTFRYLLLRACERVSPLALYGRPLNDLHFAEQLELAGFELLRDHEENPQS